MAFLRTPAAALALPPLMMLGLISVGCAGAAGTPPPAQSADTPPAVSTAAPPAPPADSYEAGIDEFRKEHEAALKTDTGWLTIAGLFFISQPHMTFGSDPLSDIVMPEGAPAQAGAFDTRDGKVTVTAAPGITFQLNGKPITTAVLKSDGEGPPDRFSFGDFQMWVHMSGGRQSIRLRDRNSKLRREFTSTSWFPIDKAYNVEATYQPYPTPRTIQVPNMLGDIDNMTVPGVVSFTLNGQALKMEAITETDTSIFWFIFRDLTSGKETYPAARFLYMPAPVNGKMRLDFNKAENPPCAYNPYATCPLPPEQNRLRVRIPAGEKAYAGHS